MSPGSGVAAASLGFWARTRRIASADAAVCAGRTRMILASAVAAGSSESTEPCQPRNSAITRPSASALLNIKGGMRAPRPTRYPPYGPLIDSIGMPASRRIATYRRAARSDTPRRSASASPVSPGRFWISSSASNARAVGLESCTPPMMPRFT